MFNLPFNQNEKSKQEREELSKSNLEQTTVTIIKPLERKRNDFSRPKYRILKQKVENQRKMQSEEINKFLEKEISLVRDPNYIKEYKEQSTNRNLNKLDLNKKPEKKGAFEYAKVARYASNGPQRPNEDINKLFS